jgi:hypothetical protein
MLKRRLCEVLGIEVPSPIRPLVRRLIEIQDWLEVRCDSNPPAQGAPILNRLRNVAMMEVWSKG